MNPMRNLLLAWSRNAWLQRQPTQRRFVKLAVRHMPGSATPSEQLALAGIDAGHIAAAARELATRRSIPHLEESRP